MQVNILIFGDFCQLCKCAFKIKFGDIDDIKGHTTEYLSAEK